jgi:hypothetical protein
MPDDEETRLLAVLKDCHWLSRVALDALTRPVHSVIMGSAAHHKLIEAEKVASEQYETAKAALWAWRNPKPRVSSAGGF